MLLSSDKTTLEVKHVRLGENSETNEQLWTNYYTCKHQLPKKQI